MRQDTIDTGYIKMNLVAIKANHDRHAELAEPQGYVTIEKLRHHHADFVDLKKHSVNMKMG